MVSPNSKLDGIPIFGNCTLGVSHFRCYDIVRARLIGLETIRRLFRSYTTITYKFAIRIVFIYFRTASSAAALVTSPCSYSLSGNMVFSSCWKDTWGTIQEKQFRLEDRRGPLLELHSCCQPQSATDIFRFQFWFDIRRLTIRKTKHTNSCIAASELFIVKILYLQPEYISNKTGKPVCRFVNLCTTCAMLMGQHIYSTRNAVGSLEIRTWKRIRRIWRLPGID